MRSLAVIAVSILLVFVTSASAELQNVQVGGSIFVLADYYRNVITPGDGLRWPGAYMYGRAVGTPLNDVFSWFGGDRHGPGLSYVAQWTRLNVRADFTESVTAFIELDSTDFWGDRFRSNYITGVDGRPGGLQNPGIYQSYIEMRDLFGAPLRARIGRQELVFGSEWLVGNNDFATVPVWGLSFDAVRLTWAGEVFSVDAWWSKLVERSPLEEDGDADFSGIYASYTGIDRITLDAYWLWLRDAAAVNDTQLSFADEWLEGLLGLDNYGKLDLHTVGLRAAGARGPLDFEAEVSYQWGDAAPVGAMFAAFTYGDDSARYDVWGANLELGYTFDAPRQPRVHLGYTYLGGQDNRDITFGQWLETFVNPFYRAPASVSFNRLFSDKLISLVLGESDMSNLHAVSGGISASLTEKASVGLDVTYLRADKAFHVPPHVNFGKVLDNYVLRVPLAPDFSFWTRPNAKELGWETALYIDYDYSDDFTFGAGWARLFPSRGLRQGHFISSNGLDFAGSSGNAPSDYFYLYGEISFGS